MPRRLLFAAALLAAGTTALAPNAGPTAAAGTEYVGITPARYMDTRPGFSTFDDDYVGFGPISGNAEVVELPIAGKGEVPEDVLAVALNVTVTGATAAGYVTVWPCTAQMPTASNLNYVADQTVANAVVSATDFEGHVCFYAKAPVHVIVDVVGYFPPSSSYLPLVPQRIYDSRFETCGGAWNSSEILSFGYPLYEGDVEEGCTSRYPEGPLELPVDAEAAMLNLTAVATGGPGYISTADCDDNEQPRTSTLSFDRPGQVVPNLALATVTQSDTFPGMLCFRQKNNGHFVIDAFGYFPAGSGYTPIAPARIVDSRPTGRTDDDLDARLGRTDRFEEFAFAITGRLGGTVPAVAAAVVNVTVTGSDEPGWVAVYPCGTKPTTSTVNFAAGQTVANAAFVSPGTGDRICYQASRPVHVIVDLQGWF
ncbi:MAG TPA: hypothetical protein VNQ73_23990 [Ilumatobacter sp.]|nr:hypothetical protein [Ilumatobacter sp.]